MIKVDKNIIIRRYDKELLVIEPWGKGLRVRATERHEFIEDDIQALINKGNNEANITIEGESAFITNGKITCHVLDNGELQFFNQKGELLLAEYNRTRKMAEGRSHFASALEILPRTFSPKPGVDNYKLTVRFESDPNEKLYGMGQYQQPYLNIKGCVLELAQRNSQASVPFLLSNKGYGMLWNNPAIGKVSFGKNVTEWVAESTKQMDYWITAGDTPSEIEENYADVTGKAPEMPEYGLGFWQSKLRYMTQEEILEVAREYYKRNIPVDVIVVDYYHWTNQGDWDFDPVYWPDPAAMAKELKSMGMRLMVSIWPTVEEKSKNYNEMLEKGYLTRSEYGKRLGQLNRSAIMDATNPDCRSFVWDKIKKNYYDRGVDIFWLDEAEPEFTGYEFEHYRYYRGADMEIGNVFPRLYAQMAYDGLKKEGQDKFLTLLRCAWAGSQRLATLVWSGDCDSSFMALRNQIAAGLNMGLAGIPWWTTDIGGFHGGNIYDEKFKEVFVRWFEFGCFCPVMRLHGDREPFVPAPGVSGGGEHNGGAPNEIWTYGDRVYEICKKYIMLREKLRPYLRTVMKEASEKGTPVIRPLFYDYPQDDNSWNIEDEYMFGPDILVAPVLYENTTERKVYLPKGEWTNINDGKETSGPATIMAPAPYEYIPVFVKKGTHLEILNII